MKLDKKDVLKALENITVPGEGQNMVESGAIKNIQIFGDEVEIDKKASIVLFRILQEFFSNTIKHSKATNLEVTLNYMKDKLILYAKDNGVGFLINEKKEGIGLSNIKNRIKLIGAEINFVTAENKGTSIEITYKYE